MIAYNEALLYIYSPEVVNRQKISFRTKLESVVRFLLLLWEKYYFWTFLLQGRFLICLNIRIIFGLENLLLLKLINNVPSFPTRPGLTRPPDEFIHKFYILVPKKLDLKAEREKKLHKKFIQRSVFFNFGNNNLITISLYGTTQILDK